MDYFLSSRYLEIERTDGKDPARHYTERLIQTETLALGYERPEVPDDLGSRQQLGLPVDRHLYACPQTLFKFHPSFDRVLAEILRADPLGCLVLIEGRVPQWTHTLKRRLRRHIDDFDSRVLCLPALPRVDFLRLLHHADVLLDPFHFGGGNTTLEACAIGTPVVTLPGEFLRGRIAAGIYQQCGLTGLIVDNESRYIQRAVEIGCDMTVQSTWQERILAGQDRLFGVEHEYLEFTQVLRMLADRVTRV